MVAAIATFGVRDLSKRLTGSPTLAYSVMDLNDSETFRAVFYTCSKPSFLTGNSTYILNKDHISFSPYFILGIHHVLTELSKML